MDQAAYIQTKKLKLSSKTLTVKVITKANGPTRCHIQKSLCASQERYTYVSFIRKVVWSSLQQIFPFCFQLWRKPCFLRVLSSVFCRFFFLPTSKWDLPTRRKVSQMSHFPVSGCSIKADDKDGTLARTAIVTGVPFVVLGCLQNLHRDSNIGKEKPTCQQDILTWIILFILT